MSAQSNTCPRDGAIQCIVPGPVDGGCCKVIPKGHPINFSVSHRNTGHWDVTTRWGRAFRIRGEPRDVVVFDERVDDDRPFPRDPLRFKSINTALAWCADELMEERSS